MLRHVLGLMFSAKRRFLPETDVGRAFPRFDCLIQRLANRFKADFVEDVLGHRMYLDERDSSRLSFTRVYEPFETRWFLDHVGPDQVVVDVGANIGYYTLLLAKQVGRQGRVFAFEPDPANFEILQKNVELNGYQNVTLERLAVSDVSGPVRLLLNDANRGDHRISVTRSDLPSIDVQSVRLDDYFTGYDAPIDVIKMDIQGAEHRALVGMQGLLSRNPQLKLVTEFWPFALAGAQSEPQAMLELLSSLGFRPHEIDERRQRVRAVAQQDLLSRFTEDNRAGTNLLFERSSEDVLLDA